MRRQVRILDRLAASSIHCQSTQTGIAASWCRCTPVLPSGIPDADSRDAPRYRGTTRGCVPSTTPLYHDRQFFWPGKLSFPSTRSGVESIAVPDKVISGLFGGRQRLMPWLRILVQYLGNIRDLVPETIGHAATGRWNVVLRIHSRLGESRGHPKIVVGESPKGHRVSRLSLRSMLPGNDGKRAAHGQHWPLGAEMTTSTGRSWPSTVTIPVDVNRWIGV
ncbi:uncharacterized protein ATNIH1004_002080 [Aspergillus tanneri]|uniref:Uncharacterized protein n=1 Tax=Aspergillus tanneri TaxID=1220188 RepID=A0A5M9M9Q4_9EURO|nr:uncharacterized protein ATNIH1004_002080 [Aspergillus tanneri]KAA8641279.1 hypothetical protein ATNIH1004_002080 [Aspergillus tanneri]